MNGIEEHIRGPSFWKFNASLLDDKDYVTLINSRYEVWVEEFKDIEDLRLFWDLIKYTIRQDKFLLANVKQGKERQKWQIKKKN